jgi:hypothetical protein
MKVTRARFILILTLCTIFWLQAGFAWAQAEQKSLGKYWINIAQTGKETYEIRMELTASQGMEVRVVRVPVFIDPSRVPGKLSLSPLETATLKVPISFTGKGEGELKIACKSTGDQGSSQYVVFKLFNSVRGSKVKELVSGAADLLIRSGSSSAVIQLSGKITPMRKSAVNKALAGATFGETKALRGLAFLGVAKTMDGKIEKRNLQEELLELDVSKAGRVASFVEAGTLPPLAKEAVVKKQNTSGNKSSNKNTSTAGNVKSQPVEQNKPAENKAERATEVKKPQTGPFTTYSNVVTVQRLPVKRDWSNDKSGAGHFVEVPLELPPEFFRAKSIDDIRLVLSIYPEPNRYATGRIFVSDQTTLATTGQRGEDHWFAHKVERQGTFLGEFDTEYDGNAFSFDLTDWFLDEDRPMAFVSILNLSRSPLELKDIRLEIKGVR